MAAPLRGSRPRRALPLSGRLLDIFARRWRLRMPACPFVFHRGAARWATAVRQSAKRGRTPSGAVVRFDVSWRKAAAAIGHPGLVFHDLRRSGARALRRAGIDEVTIMARGAWKTRSMFVRYSIVDEQDQREAQEKLDAAFTTRGRRTVVPLRSDRR